MLTAHALNAHNFAKSMDGGACAYLPKETIADIDTFLAEIMEDNFKECGLLGKWLDRLQEFYENKFGPGWLDEYEIVS